MITLMEILTFFLKLNSKKMQKIKNKKEEKIKAKKNSKNLIFLLKHKFGDVMIRCLDWGYMGNHVEHDHFYVQFHIKVIIYKISKISKKISKKYFV